MPDLPAIAQTLLVLFTGLGLAAAVGFRIFLPVLLASLATRNGFLEVADGFQWVASTPALVAFSLATVLEIAAYYVPVVDNLLDVVATPMATIAGTLLATAVLVDFDPWVRWSLGVVAGGGLATLIHVPTAAGRAASTGASGGLLNAGFNTAEILASSLVSVLAVFIPIAIPMVLIALVTAYLYKRKKPKPKAG